jgi:hypothetical protein
VSSWHRFGTDFALISAKRKPPIRRHPGVGYSGQDRCRQDAHPQAGLPVNAAVTGATGRIVHCEVCFDFVAQANRAGKAALRLPLSGCSA